MGDYFDGLNDCITSLRGALEDQYSSVVSSIAAGERPD